MTNAVVTGIECSDQSDRVGLQLRLPPGVTVKPGDIVVNPLPRVGSELTQHAAKRRDRIEQKRRIEALLERIMEDESKKNLDSIELYLLNYEQVPR